MLVARLDNGQRADREQRSEYAQLQVQRRGHRHNLQCVVHICLTLSASRSLAVGPQLAVSGKGVAIPSPASSASLADGTKFAAQFLDAAAQTQLFAVQNTGDQPLSFASPAITLTGSSSFTVVNSMLRSSASLAPGEWTNFTVQFLPSALIVLAAC